jgi:transposase
MYIRQTTTRSKKDGSSYQSYRLVESFRVGNKVKQQTLLNLGTEFSISRDSWDELTNRIEAILHHQPSLLPLNETIEAEAQRIASNLLLRNKEYASSDEHVATADYCTVDIDSIESSELRSVGLEHMAYDALQSLQLDTQLSALGLNRTEVATAIGTIIGRMIAPGSELSTHRWLQRESGLGEIIDYDFNQCSLSRLYRVSDQLLQHRDELETHLFARECTLFDLSCTITLYDLTNTFFEGSGKYNDQAVRGRSKEKRSDCPLVTLGLVLDSSGFPRSSRVFAGNASEPATLETMVTSLAGAEANALIVMDAGIATEANLQWLQERNYRYLVVSRKRHVEWDEELSQIVRVQGTNEVRIYSKPSDDGEEVELYCRSSSRAAKEVAIDSLFQQRFETQIRALADGLNKKGSTKRYDKVLQRVGRLQEKYARVAQHYTIEVEKDPHSNLATKLHFERTNVAAKEYAGVYCLRTNMMDWDAEKLWRTYIMLTDLEAVFRSLKSELGMRPVYHQTTMRVEGHLWITLLAYHLVHHIRLRLKAAGIHDSWDTLRQRMRSHMRVTTTMRTKDNKTLHIRKAARPEPWQQAIYQALDLPQNPGGIRKTIIPD